MHFLSVWPRTSTALAKLMADPKLAIFRKIVGASTVMVPSGSADLHTWDLWFLFLGRIPNDSDSKALPFKRLMDRVLPVALVKRL